MFITSNQNYGTTIPNLTIQGRAAPYPVINERSVRATAGIMFVVGIITFMYVFITKIYWPLYLVVPVFFIEFLLKTLFGPEWSLFDQLGKRLVSAQTPEYVGAVQKRFAWAIGLVMASIMLIAAVGFGVRGWLPLSICVTCLFFMWMETSLGICVGCKIYSYLLDKKIIPEPAVRPVCPGGVCSVDTHAK